MARRTVLITGGTSGLGLRTAAELARERSWHVVVTGRDFERTRVSAERIGAEAMGLELGSLADVRRFAAAFDDRERPPLHAIVCNAGVQFLAPGPVSDEGYETTFAVNHLGHFLLVQLLLGRLARPARVVIVSSNTHDPAQRTGMPAPRYTTAAELAAPGADWAAGDTPAVAGRRRYTTSKLCNVLLAYELQRRFDDRGIDFNAFDPGMMPGTGLARDYPAYQRLAWRFLMPALTVFARNVNTPRQSARALARLVDDPALEGTGGRYFSGTHEVASSEDSRDEAKAVDLWATSLTLAGLSATPAQASG
jgi:light-dependent protochlorophyllide reductase